MSTFVIRTAFDSLWYAFLAYFSVILILDTTDAVASKLYLLTHLIANIT